MTPRGQEAAALALHRFGFGPAGDAIAAIAADPRGAVLADLERPQAGLINVQLPSSSQAAHVIFAFRAEQQAQRKLAQRAKTGAGANAMAARMSGTMDPVIAAALREAKPFENTGLPLPQQLYQDEATARFDAATADDIGFVERLVWFWSNHFCISADKAAGMAGSYEREAIRPHVLGRFADLLQAVESHPAMLFYLDNVESMGPNSTAGINRDKGLNENLARETLELHTLGVRTGYTQADVTNFAKVLTGWTWFPPGELLHGGEFVFNPLLHEPDDQTVLGKIYPNTGVQQGRAVLEDLARHPATAQHIAQKLAVHFVADEPPPALVGKLENTFLRTGGDLKEVAKALVTADESWTPQRQKIKPPSRWIVAMLRLAGNQWRYFPQVQQSAQQRMGLPGPIGRMLNAPATLGEALWRPPAPNGWPDTESTWIDGVPRRLDIANEFANRIAPDTNPLALLDAGLGPLASPATREVVAHAESRAQAVTLLVMAPEFLRS